MTGGESSVLEFSDDGRWLLVGYYSGDAVLWDLKQADGARFHRLPRRHQKGVGHADFSPDGAWLATTGVSTFGDRSPSTLWRLDPGDAFLEAVPLPASGDIPRFTEFSPDGRWLLQASATAYSTEREPLQENE